jgi:hypothetical protein
MSKSTIIRDFYSNRVTLPLNNSKLVQFGVLYTTTEVYRSIDAAGLQIKRGYVVSVKNRLIIPGNNLLVGAQTIEAYNDYLAMVDHKLAISAPIGAEIRILGYFPKTLNSAVSEDESSASGLVNRMSSGSVNTNINAYAISLDGGFYSDIPANRLALTYSPSWIKDHLQENVLGKAAHLNDGAQSGHSMSLKDWMAIGRVDPLASSVEFVYAQENPWNTFLYNSLNSDGGIDLPDWVSQRLVSNGKLLPPSELSLAGLDLCSRATWLIEFPVDAPPAVDESVTLTHQVNLFSASHSLNNQTVHANLDSVDQAQTAVVIVSGLNMEQYALAPIDQLGYVNFVTDEFTIAPSANPSQNFKINSRNFDLQIVGNGFGEMMSINNLSASTSAEVDLQFKISDLSQDYSLVIAHELVASSQNNNATVDLVLSLEINGEQTLVKEVAAFGLSEVVLPLRRLSQVANKENKDYLNLGLNSIKVAFSVGSGVTSPGSTYNLRSITLQSN